MQIRIVCEGRTDVLLIEQVILSVFGPCDINSIQPARDNLGKWGTAGWTEVKRWCQRGVEEIADEMALAGIDVIVVHLDGDLCGNEGLPATPSDLCDHIKSEWLGGAPPHGLLICIPMQTTDTWLAAALDPSVSESDDPLVHLVRLGLLLPARAEKKPRRSEPAYRHSANQLGAAAMRIRATLPELDRFMSKLEAMRG